MEEADAAALVQLAPALAQLPLLQAYQLNAAKLLASLQKGQSAGEGLLVARDTTGTPVGLAWFAVRGGLGLAGYLRLLAVLPQAAGQGVGKVLLQAFEQASCDARGGQLVLCNARNAAALAFYRQGGYEQVGELPGFVHAEHTEILLRRRRVG